MEEGLVRYSTNVHFECPVFLTGGVKLYRQGLLVEVGG